MDIYENHTELHNEVSEGIHEILKKKPTNQIRQPKACLNMFQRIKVIQNIFYVSWLGTHEKRKINRGGSNIWNLARHSEQGHAVFYWTSLVSPKPTSDKVTMRP